MSRGGGGKANTPEWGVGNRVIFGGTLGNRGIIDFSYNFLDDTNVCSKVLVVW